MKIEYKKRHLNVNLILGITMLTFGLLNLGYDGNNSWSDYGYIVFAVCYLFLYFYQKQYKYLTIQNGVLNINGSLGKKINLTEVIHIKKFAGDYILKTNKKKLTINTHIIDPKSLTELNAELKKLRVEWH